jgi:hypothetical protein
MLTEALLCVCAGLIKLFNRNEDMLATVIGHECAHAVARHSSEKLTLGLFVALAVQVGLALVLAANFHTGLGDCCTPRAEALVHLVVPCNIALMVCVGLCQSPSNCSPDICSSSLAFCFLPCNLAAAAVHSAAQCVARWWWW